MSAPMNHAAQRADERRAVKGFWAKAERHRGEQLIAARAILETPATIAKNGGEGSAVVSWADSHCGMTLSGGRRNDANAF